MADKSTDLVQNNNPYSFSVIAENDESQWADQTGNLYHFPSRYLKFLQPETKLIYYKNKLKKTQYRDKRLATEPHYFGIGTVKKIFNDVKSRKNDYYAEIKDFLPFSVPIIAKTSNGYYEKIPESRSKNYWRDGVRPIDSEVYFNILESINIISNLEEVFDDIASQSETFGVEGQRRIILSSVYERDPKLRKRALLIHGFTCFGCGFNFEKTYGELGKNFIHVHHTKPLFESGETKVNPVTDLIPLCPNCHSMVHRNKYKVISLEELQFSLIKSK